jgi:hypothetical protein
MRKWIMKASHFLGSDPGSLRSVNHGHPPAGFGTDNQWNCLEEEVHQHPITSGPEDS